MKLQIIQISDMHIKGADDAQKAEVKKIVSSLKVNGTADECVLVLSGDLAWKGENYNFVRDFKKRIVYELTRDVYASKNITVVCVPGNHDICFANFEVSVQDIEKHYRSNSVPELCLEYIGAMKEFFEFSRSLHCFEDDNYVSKKEVVIQNKRICFVMINSAPLSLCGGSSEDMGMHFLSNSSLNRVEECADGDINILVCHHSLEWFASQCKERLRKIINKKYAVVLYGHEHQAIGDSRKIYGEGVIPWIQCNALYGSANGEAGFCSLELDLDTKRVKAYVHSWEKEIYVPRLIAEEDIKYNYKGGLTLKPSFVSGLQIDELNRKIEDYYVFPSFSYNRVKEDQTIENCNVEAEDELFDVISKYNCVTISGPHKSGKTALAKRICYHFIEEGKLPLLISANDIIKRHIDRTVEYVFCDQYADKQDYEVFAQSDKAYKVALLDDAHLIDEKSREPLRELLKKQFGTVIVFTEENREINIKKQVVDAIVEQDEAFLSIKPFLFGKRKELIGNVLRMTNCAENVEAETNKINEMINVQVKYFNLDPEFIISFVNKYENEYRFQFSSGLNVFSVVYESSIRNRIIANSNNIDPQTVINVLQELAFFLHFNQKQAAKLETITGIIDEYCKTYRQRVNYRLFLNATLAAKILVETDNEYRFVDRTLVAYFVALALQRKFNQGEEDEIQGKLVHLLHNLCFSINSDIVLFLALITNNPRILNYVLKGAEEHFANLEELSFDKKNIAFILKYDVPVKKTLPTSKDRKEREKKLEKHEEEVKVTDIVELVNEYDYTEEDLKKVENQTLISFKYIEILSKALPAFCSTMKVDQQDRMVKLLYSCPNKFLYSLFKEIDDDYEGVCNSIYEDISALRREKEIVEVDLDSVQRMIGQIAVITVAALYQIIATTSVTDQTITALNDFTFSADTNHKVQNIYMVSRLKDIHSLSVKVQPLYKSTEYSVVKSMLRHAVRDFLIRNQVEIYGEAESLIDCVFENKKKTKMEIAKKRILEMKHREDDERKK